MDFNPCEAPPVLPRPHPVPSSAFAAKEPALMAAAPFMVSEMMYFIGNAMNPMAVHAAAHLTCTQSRGCTMQRRDWVTWFFYITHFYSTSSHSRSTTILLVFSRQINDHHASDSSAISPREKN
ncbi:MAG: hypothetical protein QUS07_10950 [Methanothrix sp.]|nr:hypothetical protein [Methanothrix sp.]